MIYEMRPWFYPLKLNSGGSITHNRFVGADWDVIMTFSQIYQPNFNKEVNKAVPEVGAGEDVTADQG